MASKIQWKNLDEIRVEMAKKWEKMAKQNMAWSKKSKIKMASPSSPISKMQQSRSRDVGHEQYWIFITHVSIL